MGNEFESKLESGDASFDLNDIFNLDELFSTLIDVDDDGGNECEDLRHYFRI